MIKLFKKYSPLFFLLSTFCFGASTFTTHYNLEKAADGDDAWGDGYRDNLDAIDTQLYVTSTSLADHVAQSTDAHAASSILSTAGALVCTTSVDVQAFLDCLDFNFGSITGGSVVTLNTAQTITAQKTFSIAPIISPFSSAGLVHNDSSGLLSSSQLINADIDNTAAIAYSKLNLSSSILNADINSSAAIAYSKLASMSTGQVLLGNAGTPTATTISGDAAIGATGTLTIANSAITNAKVSASAAIDYSKLASMSTGQVLLGNAGTPTATTLSGDVTVGATGVTAIGANKVTDAMLRQSAGLSIIGRSANSTGNVTDITASAANQILRMNTAGTILGFGSIDLSASGAVGSSILPIANGGTGQFSLSSGVVYSNGTSALTTESQLAISRGGTNSSATATAGGVGYGTGTAHAYTSAGTSGQYLKSNGSSAPTFATFTAPTVQKFTSGSGTYTTAANVLYIRVRLIGGGGGGAGSGTGAGTAAGDGGDTTFGSSLLSGSGGVKGVFAGTGGVGGAASLGSGPVGIATAGGGGGSGGVAGVTGIQNAGGGSGGSGMFGGAAGGGTSTGAAAATNSGAGGAGAGGAATTNVFGGSGGGSGGSVNAIITSPSATYSYAVGAAGSAGGAGASGNAGGAGAAGVIIVEEYYQ